MIEEIKKRKATNIPDQHLEQPSQPHIPLISPDQAIDDKDIIKCPTCHNGHIHNMETDGVSYKCTGPECGKEYVMIDKSADYKCVGCGAPIKRPEDEKLKIDSCPFCKGKKAVKFDWNKLWKLKPQMAMTAPVPKR
jgi:DNA-directed RNA polymerase subunit RPC12/RpoP